MAGASVADRTVTGLTDRIERTVTEPGRRELNAELWMLGAALSFSVMGACTHALGSRCHWLVVALVRVVFMFSATATLARLAGVPLPVWRPRTLWIRSLAGSFSLVCNFYALARLPVADALTLSNAYPLWILVITTVVSRRWPGWAVTGGLLCGLAGVALIERPRLDGDQGAAAVALLSSVSTAIAMLGLHRLRGIDTRSIVAHFSGVGTLVAGVLLLFQPDALSWSLLEPVTLALLLGVAASGTIGQFCLTRAYAAGVPARVAVIGLSQVLFALAFDILIWHRSLTPAVLAGIVLVLVPTAWLSGRSSDRRRPEGEPDPHPAPAPVELGETLEAPPEAHLGPDNPAPDRPA